MSGTCRGCFRHLAPTYGSDLCPACEERAEWEAERDDERGPCPTCEGLTEDPCGGPCRYCWERVA